MASKEGRTSIKCATCSLFRPGRTWDDHELCPMCRSCSRRDPCSICVTLTPANWQEIEAWMATRREKLQSKLTRLSPPPAPASEPEAPEGSVLEPVASGDGSPLVAVPVGSGNSTSSNAKSKGKRSNKGKGKAPRPKRTTRPEEGSTQLQSTGPQTTEPPDLWSTGPPELPVPADLSSEIQLTRDRGKRPAPQPTRPRSRSRSPHPRDPSPVQDESSQDSDSGYRRRGSDRPTGARDPPRGERPQADGNWLLSQLSAILQPLVAQMTPAQNAATTDASTAPQLPVRPLTLDQGRPPLTPMDHDLDALELVASETWSERGDEASVLDEYESQVDEAEDEEDEEQSVKGIDLPPDLIAKAIHIFTTRLGFEPPPNPKPTERTSKLRTTNEPSQSTTPCVPVDAVCFDRIEGLQAKKRWTAFPAKQDRALKIHDDTWKRIFKVPSITGEVRDRLRAEQALSSGYFREPLRKKAEQSAYDLDQASRVGMKFASTFMLAAELLMRHHQQLPEDKDQIPDREASQILWLLGPLARLIYDQFARMSVKLVESRRDNVLAAMRWPDGETRERLTHLPIANEDLFAGQFADAVQSEFTKRDSLAKTSFSRLNTRRPQGQNAPTRSFSGPRPVRSRGRSNAPSSGDRRGRSRRPSPPRNRQYRGAGWRPQGTVRSWNAPRQPAARRGRTGPDPRGAQPPRSTFGARP
ncbi:uncharacterized protein [Apostichopus japonicus]|uniref:uncharacterized protein n=1 Tax=Stichopus japonicus TaxID=307972 RepID=UPI003AB86FD3